MYPTAEQAHVLAQTFGCCRFVYNRFLKQRELAHQNGKRMNYAQTSAALTRLKKDPVYQWLNDVSSVPLQQSLRHLNSAYTNFFKKCAKHPTFKRKTKAQTAEYTKAAFRFDLITKELTIAGLGPVKVRWSRKVPVQPTTVTAIRKRSGRYFVSLVLDIAYEQMPKTGDGIGIDLGLTRFAALSNAEIYPYPKFLYKYSRLLTHKQRELARKKNGSKRYERCRLQVARLHEKIADCRKDAIKKFARQMVQRFDFIAMEDLNVAGMVKNHNLARSISDVGMGYTVRTIEQMAAMHGKTAVEINRFYPSSKLCSACGYKLADLALAVRAWICPSCGATHDRDINAAKNILTAGLAATARGGDVRPDVATAVSGGLL